MVPAVQGIGMVVSMRVPDIFMAEPTDNELCTVHERYRPCRECRNDESDRQYQTTLEDRL